MSDADLVIVGAGPAGVAAALEASRLGARVIVVDHEGVGGTCLHRGCVPTVAMMDFRRRHLAASDKSGSRGEKTAIPAWDQVYDVRQGIVHHLQRGTARFLEQRDIPLLSGSASLQVRGEPIVSLAGPHPAKVTAPAVLLANGAAFTLPDIPGIEAPQVWTTDHALGLQEVPRRLLIYGGSFIGIEWAQFFRAMGSDVVVLEAGDQILPGEDAEIAEALTFLLEQSGIEVLTRWPVIALEQDHQMIEAVGPGTRLRADRFLVADCRRPRTALLSGAATGPDGGIWTDGGQKTGVPGVYAAGDVTGGRMLSHWARGQGEVAAHTALGDISRFDPQVYPRVYHCDPEVAAVGMTADEASAQGYDVVVGEADLAFNARAVILDQSRGMVKVVADRRHGKILGVHLLAPLASEVIGQAALAIRLEALAEDLAGILPGHPTVAEALTDAAREVVRQL